MSVLQRNRIGWLAVGGGLVTGITLIACTGGGSDSAGSAATTEEVPAEAEAATPTPEPSPDDEIRTFFTAGWETDFTIHTVPYDEITSGGPPKDGIPAIDSPKSISFGEADEFVAPQEPVIALAINGDARAYPLQILIWHEIVNDEVGGVPVTVTFCPLCNTAIVFERTLQGVVYDFGTTGNLRFSDLIMYDRQTESWWQQITGEAIVGELTGRKLTFVPAQIISYEQFKTDYPTGTVLSRDTGFSRNYGVNPYLGYDQADVPPFLYRGPEDDRLPPKERVATVTIGDVDVAYPFSVLEQELVVNDEVAGQPIVVLFAKGTTSALDRSSIADSQDVGATGVFSREVNGGVLTFRADGDAFVDEETGSRWTLTGQATEGELAGAQLEPILHSNHFWFSWAVFKPDTIIYGS